MERMPKSVTVANRSVARAQELCDEFGIQSILMMRPVPSLMT